MFTRKNVPLIIGIAVPILTVAAIAIGIYAPRVYTHPQQSFVYVEQPYYTGAYYGCSGAGATYSVINGRVTQQEPKMPQLDTVAPPTQPCAGTDEKVYLYDVKTDKNTELTAQQAASYSVTQGGESADGFNVAYRYSGESFPFSRAYSSDGVYIEKGNYSKRLNIPFGSSGASAGFQLLGWIK